MPDPDDPERWLAGEMKCVQHSSSCAMRTFAQHEVSATARGPSSRERWSNQRQILGSIVDCRISGSAEASAATNLEQEANDSARIPVRREAVTERKEPGRPLPRTLGDGLIACHCWDQQSDHQRRAKSGINLR